MLGGDLWALLIVATISTHLGEEHELVLLCKGYACRVGRKPGFCRTLVREPGEIDESSIGH